MRLLPALTICRHLTSESRNFLYSDASSDVSLGTCWLDKCSYNVHIFSIASMFPMHWIIGINILSTYYQRRDNVFRVAWDVRSLGLDHIPEELWDNEFHFVRNECGTGYDPYYLTEIPSYLGWSRLVYLLVCTYLYFAIYVPWNRYFFHLDLLRQTYIIGMVAFKQDRAST